MFPTTLPQPGTRRLRQVADLSLFLLLVMAPLMMGGRHPAGSLVFSTLICITVVTLIWSHYLQRDTQWRWTGFEWLLLAALLVVAIQLVPLPQSWLGRISPSITDRLPLWNSLHSANLGLGNWSTISLHPDATLRGGAIFCAYVMLFLGTAQRLSDRQSIGRVMRWVAVAASLMALIGLVQFLLGTEKFLGVYEHPSRTANGVVHGAFANQNHMAHMLALGIGPLVWWLFSHAGADRTRKENHREHRDHDARVKQGTQAGLGMAVGLVLLASLLTFSRAGIVAVLLATAAVVATLVWTVGLGRRGWATGGIMALLLCVALTMHGYDRWATRVQSLVGAESLGDVSAGRQRIWSAVQRAVGEFPLLGSGVGTHRDVYPMFLDQYDDVEYTHAESGYLQILEEAGVVGLSLLLVAIGVIGNWCRLALFRASIPQVRLMAGAVTASLLVSSFHALVDFVWYIPACMSITVVLAACAWRLSRLAADTQRDDERLRVPQPLWLAGAAGISLAAMGIIASAWGPARAAPYWDQYARLVDQAGSRRDPLAANSTSNEQSIDELVACLERIIDVDGRDARAHARLAALCIQKFDLAQQRSDNALGVTEIRDAAILSEFPSLAAQNEWLNRAVPENRHLLDLALQYTRQAVRMSPLLGESYVFLAELGFLEGGGRRAKWEYLDQALRVRPHDDNVLMAVGSEFALEGKLQQATACWRQVFNRNPVYREQIVASFAPQVTANVFLATFRPDVDGAASLLRHYRRSGLAGEARVAGGYYIAKLKALAEQNGDQGAQQWWDMYRVQSYLGQDEAALASLQSVVQLAPHVYEYRHALARQLLRQQHYAEAREHLQWCLRRKPNDTLLSRDLQVATRAELAPILR